MTSRAIAVSLTPARRAASVSRSRATAGETSLRDREDAHGDLDPGRVEELPGCVLGGPASREVEIGIDDGSLGPGAERSCDLLVPAVERVR